MSAQSDKTRIHVTALIVIAVLAWYAMLLFHGHLSPFDATIAEHFGGITTSITVGTLAVVMFRTVLWKYSLLHPWFVDTPVLEGSWTGTVLRKYREHHVDERTVPIRVRIEQPTITAILFIQTMSDGSAEGHTEACGLFRGTDGKLYLEGIYQVTKYEVHQETSGKRLIYYGAMRLQLDDNSNPKEMSGSYWSDEFTKGRVVLQREGD